MRKEQAMALSVNKVEFHPSSSLLFHGLSLTLGGRNTNIGFHATQRRKMLVLVDGPQQGRLPNRVTLSYTFGRFNIAIIVSNDPEILTKMDTDRKTKYPTRITDPDTSCNNHDYQPERPVKFSPIRNMLLSLKCHQEAC